MNAANGQQTELAHRLQGAAAAREPSGWRWLPVTLAVIALDPDELPNLEIPPGDITVTVPRQA